MISVVNLCRNSCRIFQRDFDTVLNLRSGDCRAETTVSF